MVAPIAIVIVAASENADVQTFVVKTIVMWLLLMAALGDALLCWWIGRWIWNFGKEPKK